MYSELMGVVSCRIVLCILLVILWLLKDKQLLKLRVLMCEPMLTHLKLLTLNNCKVLSNFRRFLLVYIDFIVKVEKNGNHK